MKRFLQLSLFAGILCTIQSGPPGSDDVYSDEYYYDSYEEAPAVEIEKEAKPGYGFLKPVGSAVIRDLLPLMTPGFLNMSKELFHCLPRAEARIKTSEEEERLRKEAELAQLAANADKMGEQREAFRNEINNMMKTREDLKAKRLTGKLKRKQIVEIVAGIAEQPALATAVQNASTAIAANQTNVTATNETLTNQTSPEVAEKVPLGKRRRKPTFREKLIRKIGTKEEFEKIKDSKVQKFLLGPDCETLVCGACKVLVEEFAVRVHAAVEDPKIRYVEQVFTGFCSSKEILKRYDDIVGYLCKEYLMDGFTGYEEALLRPFEEDSDWENLLLPSSIQSKAMKVCLDIGSCEEQQFELNVVPQHREQEQWDDSCFVCQAFANELEERVVLMRHVSEQDVRDIVLSICDRLNLEEEYDAICRGLTKGPQLEVIVFNTKVHEEAVQRQAKGVMRFADSLCEEAKYCEKWVPSDIFKLRQEMKELMELNSEFA